MIKKVLVIDNDSSILEVMNEVLVYQGFNVKVLEDADHILTLLDLHQPDLLILDYKLNGINGGEVCKKIKNSDGYKDLPVIIFSAYSNLLEKIKLSGCNAVLLKPFSLAELTNIITETMLESENLSINTVINKY